MPAEDPSHGWLDAVRHVFVPLGQLTTSTVSGMEILPRLRTQQLSAELIETMRGPGRVAVDTRVAAGGVRWSAQMDLKMPLHVNLLADTVAAEPGVLGELHDAVREAGRMPPEVVIEIGPPIGDPEPAEILVGAARLREHGYRLCVDEVGIEDHPLAVIAKMEPDLVKLHPEIIAGLRDDLACQTVTDAVHRLCQRIGATLVVDGITSPAELETAHRFGITVGQGPLLAEPARRPRTHIAVPARVVSTPASVVSTTRTAETIGAFAQPAVTLPDATTGDQVRDTFRDAPAITSVVLIDRQHRPVGMLDRNRFMLEVSGQFGHALHARRPARDLADPPRVLPAYADPHAALDLIAAGGTGRTYDDVVIVDPAGRCIGVARFGDLLRGIAELNYDRALALHPATGLPGISALAEALEDRFAGGHDFAIGVLTPDVTPVIRRGGHRAAVEALSVLGRAVGEVVAQFPNTVAAHATGGDIHLVTELGRGPALDAAVRDALGALPQAPAVRTAWLQHEHHRGRGARQLATELLGLGADARPLPSPRPRPGG